MNVNRFYRTYLCFRPTDLEYWKVNIVNVLQALFTLIIKGFAKDGKTLLNMQDLVSIRFESREGWIVVGILSAKDTIGDILLRMDTLYLQLATCEFFSEVPPFVKERILITIDPQIRNEDSSAMDVHLGRYNMGKRYPKQYNGKHARLRDTNLSLTKNEIQALTQILNVSTMEEFSALRELSGKVFDGV